MFTNDQLVEILRLTYQEKMPQRQIAENYECGKSTIGDFLRKETYLDFWQSQEDKPTAGGEISAPDIRREKMPKGTYVFTCAQNNTHVHLPFLESLEVYCQENNAILKVGTCHYNKNAYSKSDDQDMDCWFDPRIREYIYDVSGEVAEGLLWCGELDIIPTAVNPLSGFHSYTMNSSGVVPHVKVQLDSVPTPKYETPKMLYTTGAVTQRNYIERKSGQIASFHHVFGALVVEVDEEGDWFARQLIAESTTGCFYDLSTYYTPDGVSVSDSVEAINYGDVHAEKLDKVVAEISWGGDSSILDTLKPRKQLLHDIFDMTFRNHHNIKDSYFRYKMFINNTESVEKEVVNTAKVIKSMQREWSDIIVVESNHDLALQKWLKEQDYRYDPANAEFFLELQLESYKAIRENTDFSVFEFACKSRVSGINDVRFLRTDESYIICEDIECGSHGHNGNNGARGGVRAFQVQGKRFNVGHSHSASIKDGVYTSGHSGEVDMGYNIGGSSWSHSHIITYKNGKRTIITIKNGKWKG